MKIEVDEDDLEIVMMCAMRYTYYSSSYAVEYIQDFILKHCHENVVDKFIKDIKNFLADYKTYNFSDKHVIQSWEDTITKLNDKKNHES